MLEVMPKRLCRDKADNAVKRHMKGNEYCLCEFALAGLCWTFQSFGGLLPKGVSDGFEWLSCIL